MNILVDKMTGINQFQPLVSKSVCSVVSEGRHGTDTNMLILRHVIDKQGVMKKMFPANQQAYTDRRQTDADRQTSERRQN